MKKTILLILSITSFIYTQSYCAGDQISITDQNTNFEVCYASGNYQVGDNWSLSDYNGDRIVNINDIIKMIDIIIGN